MIGGVQRMLLTPAQSQAHDEKRRELLALLMLDQQQEVIGGGHAPGGELQGLQPPTGVVDDPFEIQSRPSTNHGGRNSTQQHVAQHPNSADQQDMHQSNNECSLRQQQNHDESVVNEGGSFPTDFPKEGLATFGALSFNSSPNGGNNTVPRRPRMPSFVRHNNQTKMRTVLGDLQTSVLASVTTPPSHPISRSGSKTATPVNSDMPSFTAGAAQRGGSASGARRLTNFTTPHQQSSAGTMPPPGGVVPSIRQLPPPSEGEGAPPDGLTMVRHVVAGNPPTTITPLNGFMQRSQNIAVTPIRPPKYRYPKFKGPQGPPEKLYVNNGHLVVGQHPTLALVQRLNLGVPLSKEQQARQDQKPSSPTTQKGNAQGPLSPTTTATGNGEETSSPHALLPNLPLQGLAHAFPTTTTTTSTPRGASADMVTPRPLGMGVRSPRTVLATELERTVIVVPTGSGRWDANEASQSLRGGRATSKQRHSPTATTTAARGAAGELSFSLESVLNITEIPI
ncbi:GPI-anchored surface protein, putative [Bodo saltans]|uniref:GPI-anchored surface protein, putative n=1 Tax=Bodo saltans TaxID=75058 RepID=A0A0S4IYF8_BODSA|nr:GPI-anchored surface protein, putative [Bodo saltans]|eukprot:CUG19257.1 GPI-anchored surface protein, putative [Bodo saltans]